MDTREINLLPEETFLEKEKQKVRQKSAFRVTLIIFLISALVIGVAFSYSVYLTSQISSIRKKTDLEKQKIERMKKREILLLWTKTKVLAIQKILGTRPLYESQLSSMDLLENLSSEGIDVTEYSMTGSKVEFTVLTDNSSKVEEFVNRLLDENTKLSLFEMVQLRSVEFRAKENNYKLSFTTTLKK